MYISVGIILCTHASSSLSTIEPCAPVPEVRKASEVCKPLLYVYYAIIMHIILYNYTYIHDSESFDVHGNLNTCYYCVHKYIGR